MIKKINSKLLRDTSIYIDTRLHAIIKTWEKRENRFIKTEYENNTSNQIMEASEQWIEATQ